MKKSKGVISILLCFLLILQTACGNADSKQETADNSSGNGTDQTETLDEIETDSAEEIPQDSHQLLHGDLWHKEGEFTRTWEKDYTSAEWEDGVCLTMFTQGLIPGNEWLGDIEEELNHRLHLNGYDFYVHFELPVDLDESHILSDESVAQRQQSGMAIDLYLTSDYRTAIENGTLLDLTDYLQSERGSNLYAHFVSGVWRQLEDENGRIYGIFANPVATSRYIYEYCPQLADVLNIDMTVFNGDISVLEEAFPRMLEQGIAPISLDCYEDLLLLSLLGFENYNEIFAIRHAGDDWEAVDLFEEEEVVSFYKQLGDWKEKGFLFYDGAFLRRLAAGVPSELNNEQFDYRFLRLRDIDMTSWLCNMNVADDGFVEDMFYVPQGQAFITENRNSQILVISADTQHPEECMQFLNLLSTDDELRRLLYLGIENYHYIWQDDVEITDINDTWGNGFREIGLEFDQSFLPGYWGEKYETEIEELNQDVIEGISLTVDCDFIGLEERYDACRQLFKENMLVFLGYYGAETGERLQALHEQLNEAGYQELIAAVNAMH